MLWSLKECMQLRPDFKIKKARSMSIRKTVSRREAAAEPIGIYLRRVLRMLIDFATMHLLSRYNLLLQQVLEPLANSIRLLPTHPITARHSGILCNAQIYFCAGTLTGESRCELPFFLSGGSSGPQPENHNVLLLVL